MRLYRRSGLTQDLLTMLRTLEGGEGVATDIHEFAQTWEDSVGEYADKAVDAVLSAYGDDADRWRQITKTWVKEIVAQGVDLIVDNMTKKFGDMISVEDILAALSAEEDIAAVKTVSLESDPVRARRGEMFDKKGNRIYPSTLDAFSDALFNYNNAPRSQNATHIAVFTAIPTGLFPYLDREMGKVVELMNDPVFKGLGLNDLGESETWKGLAEYFSDQAKEIMFKEKEVLTLTPALKKSAKTMFKKTAKKKTKYEYISDYNWRVEAKASGNPVIPVSKNKRMALRFRVVADMTALDSVERTLLDLKPSASSYTMSSEQSPVFDTGREIFLTQLTTGSTIKYAVIRMPVTEIFAEQDFGKVMSAVDASNATLLVEYWEYDMDSEGRPVLTVLSDVRPVNLATDINDDGLTWYGVGVDGLGSVVPGLDQMVQMIKDYINEVIEKMLKTEEFAQQVLADLYELILSILRRIAEVIMKIITLITKLFRVLMACDVRYAVFYGSYTDLPLIWRMVRGDYRLIEETGNSITATVISCKGDYFNKVKDKVDHLMRTSGAVRLQLRYDEMNRVMLDRTKQDTDDTAPQADGVINEFPEVPGYQSRENDSDPDTGLVDNAVYTTQAGVNTYTLIPLPLYRE